VPGSRLLAGGAEAGLVTSATFSPALGAVIALAYVSLEVSTAGARVEVEMEPGGPTIPAEVLVPPLVSSPIQRAESAPLTDRPGA
jgi:glycine cleavage system aminomethyltransferase T